MDYAWNPNCVDNRCFDFLSMIQYLDFAFIMAYDELDPQYNGCIAWANAAYNYTLKGACLVCTLKSRDLRLIFYAHPT
jgi:di-N-acetylchitobiase